MPGTFHSEALGIQGANTPLIACQYLFCASSSGQSKEPYQLLMASNGMNPLNSVYNQSNKNTQAIKYADLGGAVLYNYCMQDSADFDNAAEEKFGTWSLWDANKPHY